MPASTTAATSSSPQVVLDHAKTLWKFTKNADSSVDNTIPYDSCQDLVRPLVKAATQAANNFALSDRVMETLQKTLAATSKTFRVIKRKKPMEGERDQWNKLIQQVEDLSKLLKKRKQSSAANGSDNSGEGGNGGGATTAADLGEGLPKSVHVYLSRLQKQKKELYKNPPVLPPSKVQVYVEKRTTSSKKDEPKRDKKTGELKFDVILPDKHKESDKLKKLLKDFKPNRTPYEVLHGGSFGGTYFRSITSAVTGVSYNGNHVVKETCPKEWIDGITDTKTYLTSQTYREIVNKYKVKCGGSLGMWESSGWISDVDPYGWFQWYCNFYQGRRCSDDVRQIDRWLRCAGPKGRFRSQLCNKIIAANTRPDDTRISPVIRQTLFHWGLEITDTVIEQHRKRTGR